LVNVERRNQILQCKNKQDQYSSVVAALSLRYAMEGRGIDYETAEVLTREKGKPYLKDTPGFWFSLSHSGEMVVCAVNFGDDTGLEHSREIGVDVENIKHIEKLFEKTSKIQSTMNRIATQEERKWLYSLPEDEKTIGFLRIWTGKESFGKRNGKGIAQELVRENTLDENQYLFCRLREEYYISICLDNIKEQKPTLIPIDIAKEYLK